MAQTSPKRRQTDVAAQRVATVYARALLGATEQAGATEEVVEQLDSFVTDVLDRSPKLEAVLSSALVGHEEKSALLERLLKKQAQPLFLNFLRVLSRHVRLDLVRAVHEAVHVAHDALRGRVPVEVRASGPLTPATVQFLTERLRKATGGEPKLALREQPDLIAGIVLRIGDTIYDGSVATQLRALRHEMIERSVHEIQSRRDQFRSAGGS
ncbi:MAG: ATP synthase F1 subunit delta [Pirellulales bacterium]